jgi:hypothetical protein
VWTPCLMHRCVPPRMPPRCLSYPLTLGLDPSVESSKIWHGAFCFTEWTILKEWNALCGHGNWIKLLLGAYPRLCWELEGFFFSFFSRSQCVPLKFSMDSQYVTQVPNVFPNIFSIASHFNPICFGKLLSFFHPYGWAKGEELKTSK